MTAFQHNMEKPDCFMASGSGTVLFGDLKIDISIASNVTVVTAGRHPCPTLRTIQLAIGRQSDSWLILKRTSQSVR